jgi:hypothetical protein
MRRFIVVLGFVLHAQMLLAQAPVDRAARLTYRFARPSRSALALAMAGLPTLDAEFMSVYVQRGDSVAGIIARVRTESWQRDPEVWGDAGRGWVAWPSGVIRLYFPARLVRPARASARTSAKMPHAATTRGTPEGSVRL